MPNIFVEYQYDYGHLSQPSYDAQENTDQIYRQDVQELHPTDQIYRQDVQELPPSPVYVPSQHSGSIYTTASSSINNNQFHTINANINVSL